MATGKAGTHDPSGSPELPSNLRQDLTRALATDLEGRERACEALSQLYPEHALRIRQALGLQPGSLDAAESSVRILEPLGKGSLGEIYLGERKLDAEDLELKRFRIGVDRGRILVLREGKPGSLDALADPVLAADTGLETRPGLPRFILEELQAQPITEYSDRQRLDPDARIDLLLQACAGIHSAHQRGLCHLDLKPSNMVVDDRVPPARVRVLHFGLAGPMGDRESSLALLGEGYLGSPRYMSPEQAGRGSTEPDIRSDVFSLAAVLHELLTGFPPLFPNLVDDLPVDEMQRRIRDQRIPLGSRALGSHPERSLLSSRRKLRPWQLRRILRGDLDAILDRALAKDPEHRYSSVDAFAADLRRYREGRAVEARNENALECMSRLGRRHAKALVALLLLALAGALGYWLAPEQERAAEETRSSELGRGEESPEVENPAPDLALRSELLRSEARVLQLETEDLIAKATAADPPSRELDLREQGEALQAWLAMNAQPLFDRAERIDQLLSPEASAALASRNLEEGLRLARASIESCRQEYLQPVRARQAWVTSRLEWLEDEAHLTLDEYADRWQNSIRAIAANPRYQGLELTPQAGLIPLGRDPRSGLFEFFHPGSAGGDRSLPEPSASGALNILGDSGIVFVLIPPATVTLGAQGGDPRAENYAANYQESPDQVPATTITLPAYFLGKYELTKGQWLILAGEESGFYPTDTELPSGERIRRTHPVEGIAPEDAWRVLNWAGLRLPTEAEWEYAAMGGAEWNANPDPGALEDRANLADLSVERLQPWTWKLHRDLLQIPHLRSRWLSMDDFDDGYVVHAPVGSLAANGFGLHDMQGNLAEWCEGWTEAGADEQYLPRGDHFLSRRPAPFWRRDSLGRGIPGGQPHIGIRAARSIDP